MKIKVSKEYVDANKARSNTFNLGSERLKELFQKTIIDTGKLKSKFQWKEGNTLEIEGEVPMALHTFILEAEKHGLNVKYTKSTTIEIF